MHPTLLHIGNFELATYGALTALGYAAAAGYLYPKLKKQQIDPDTFWNLIFIIFMGAILGAKLLFIIVSWPELGNTLAQKITTILKDFRYGFVFFGGMILSVFAAIYYMRRKKLPILKTSDFLIVGLPLGHALGRIGCFMAGCCYGKPTSMPWGIAFTNPHALVPQELLGVPLHPTQLYESVGNLVIFALLHYASKKPHKNGAILVQYVILYSVMRFSLEFFRGDFRGGFLLGLSPSQLISLAAVLISLFIWKKYLRTSHG